MRLQGFHHLAIQVHDLERVAAFYRDVLGMQEQVRHRRDDGSLRSIWLALPDSGFLALEATEAEPASTAFRDGRPGHHLLALRIGRSDRVSWLQHLKARHVEVVHQTRWTFYVRDPEGNRIGLSHHPQDPLE
jgi:catechol 2,3-dioxygenase-like lactoylglutathione lyase family enzyme